MSNIKFIYLYRDGANYKSWGDVVFENSERMTLKEIENKLIAVFLSDKLFVASQVSIPETFLFLENQFTKYDHCYHEFESVEVCDEGSNDSLGRSIADFLRDIELANRNGWEAFDILDRAWRRS